MKRLLIPIDDVATSLSICRSSVYSLARKGELQLVKIGARTAVTDESVQQFIERAKVQPVYGAVKRAV